jgi:hypothetical protein
MLINLDNKTQNVSNKVMSEAETRRRLMNHAKLVGCDGDLVKIFSKYEKLLLRCSNEQEKKEMAKYAAIEIHALLGGGGELYVDNQLVVAEKP